MSEFLGFIALGSISLFASIYVVIKAYKGEKEQNEPVKKGYIHGIGLFVCFLVSIGGAIQEVGTNAQDIYAKQIIYIASIVIMLCLFLLFVYCLYKFDWKSVNNPESYRYKILYAARKPISFLFFIVCIGVFVTIIYRWVEVFYILF